MSTFDKDKGAEVRDAGIAATDRASSRKWQEAAWKAILYICYRRKEFTTDAIWYCLESRGTPAPREPRAMGPMMVRAVRVGLCVNTNRVSRSIRVECHCRPIAIYASLKKGTDLGVREGELTEPQSLFAPRTGLMRKERGLLIDILKKEDDE